MGNRQSQQLSYLENKGYQFFKQHSTSNMGSFEIYRKQTNFNEKIIIVQKYIHRGMYEEIKPELFFIAKEAHSSLFIKIHVEASNFLDPLPEKNICCNLVNPDMHSFKIAIQYYDETLESFLKRRNGGLSFQEVKLVLNRAVEVIKFFEQHKLEYLRPSFKPENIYLTPEGVVKFLPIYSKTTFSQLTTFCCPARSPLKTQRLVEETFLDLNHRKSNLGQLQSLCQVLMPNSQIEAEMAFKVKFMNLKTAHFDLVLPRSSKQTLIMLFPKQSEEGEVPLSALTVRSMIENRSGLQKRRAYVNDQNYNSINQTRDGINCSDLSVRSQSNLLISRREPLPY